MRSFSSCSSSKELKSGMLGLPAHPCFILTAILWGRLWRGKCLSHGHPMSFMTEWEFRLGSPWFWPNTVLGGPTLGGAQGTIERCSRWTAVLLRLISQLLKMFFRTRCKKGRVGNAFQFLEFTIPFALGSAKSGVEMSGDHAACFLPCYFGNVLLRPDVEWEQISLEIPCSADTHRQIGTGCWKPRDVPWSWLQSMCFADSKINK